MGESLAEKSSVEAAPDGVSTQYNPMAPPYQGNPFPSYRWLRHNQPLNYVEALGAWMVTRYDDVLAIATDPETFSSCNTVPWLNSWISAGSADFVKALEGCVPEGRFILGADPPDHTWMRSIANKAFTGRRINGRRAWMSGLADELIDRYADSGGVELVWKFADEYASRILFNLLGFPDSDYEQLRIWAEDTLVMDNPLISEADKLAAAKRWKGFDDYIVTLISDRQENPQDDMISDVVHAVGAENQRLSTEDIVFFVRGLCVGGIHTSRVTLTNTVYSMLVERQYWELACRDNSVIPKMIDESLRRDAPIRGLLRTAVSDAQFGDVTVPAGSLLLVLYDAANRDETRFPEPDRFLPDRDNVREHLAFGQGIHGCVGSHLGRTSVRVALERLTSRLPDADLAAGFVPEYLPDFFFRGLARLDIEW